LRCDFVVFWTFAYVLNYSLPASDRIGVMMQLRGKVMKTVLCCDASYDCCAQ